MKRWMVALYALAVFGLAAFSFHHIDEELEIGSPAPMTDVALLNVDGDSLSLADAAGDNGLLVMFSCNTCPWSLPGRTAIRLLLQRRRNWASA